MLAKSTIEQQLEHLRGGCRDLNPEQTAIWMEALEWVLGDDKHRAAWAGFVESLQEQVTFLGLRAAEPLPAMDPVERTLLRYSLQIALRQLS